MAEVNNHENVLNLRGIQMHLAVVESSVGTSTRRDKVMDDKQICEMLGVR